MIRTPLILVASFGLLAGCATSSANTPSNNPDAGKVDYDVKKPDSGSGASDGGSAGNSGGSSATPPKGVDSTSTHTTTKGPKTVKKIAASKPPKVEEPVDPKKPPPKRKGRVDPNGLLGESFAVDATISKVPDFSGTAATLFIAPNLEAGRLPAALKSPVALRFTGSLNITEAHEYKFCTNSSDGSKLLIEGTVVVSNDGVHQTATEVCEVVQLEPGEYGVEIQSFHVSGAIALTASWATSKDGTPTAIPKTAFFKPDGADDKVKASAAK